MFGNVYRMGTHQSVAYTASAATITNGFNALTNVVRIVATTDCFFKIDNSPTATTSDVFIPANKPEYFVVSPSMKASAIQSASAGTLHVTECTG